jgi:cell division protein FtsL
MGKELGAAGEMVAAEASAGFSNFKETVYNALANFFNWLSTHQALGLIIILIVLAIIIWLILRAKKISKQLEEKVSNQNKEIGKKDAQIAEQKNKLSALQKELSDQKTVVSEALLRTLKTLTGYDSDQLKIFFKFLTEISGNPLQLADTQVSTEPKTQQLEEKGDDSAEENEATKKIAAGTGPEEVVEANKKGEE